MTQIRSLGSTEIRVVSDLSGTIYYHWYDHGQWLRMTAAPVLRVSPAAGEEMAIEVIDTTDPDYDYVANAPDGYPPWRRIAWRKSSDADVAEYVIEREVNGGGWTEVARVPHDPRVWQYEWQSGPLTDLSVVQFLIKAVDTAGNVGSAKTLAAETVVRTPDAPAFTANLDEGTGKVTIAAA